MSEHDEQAALIEWARLSGLRWLFAIPNGSKLPFFRNKKGERVAPQAQKLLAEGLTPGVSDLFLPIPAGGYHGFFMETKVKGGKPTPEQLAFIKAMREAGYKADWYEGWDVMREAICEYLGWKDA